MINIPLPQATKLYESTDNKFVEPMISLDSLDFSGNNDEYLTLDPVSLKYLLYNQNVYEMNVSFDCKNISCTRSGIYYSLDGFEYGFDLRFLNNVKPTICYAPVISAIDKGSNVNLVSVSTGYYRISRYSSVLTNNLLLEGQYILLRNQGTLAQNVIYRITEVIGPDLTVYNDSLDTNSVNYILGQDQDYIFTRAKVVDSAGVSYFGLYNTSQAYWVPQEYGIQLSAAKYGISINTELASNKIERSMFPDFTLNLGDVVAINVTTRGDGVLGGKSSGLYTVLSRDSLYYYLDSIYADYVHIHQFFNVENDMDTKEQNVIWYVDPATTQNITFMYASVDFCFKKYSNSAIQSDPSKWAKQVGGRTADIIGFSVFTTTDSFVQKSDEFSLAIKCPTWSEKNIQGMKIRAKYATNILGEMGDPEVS